MFEKVNEISKETGVSVKKILDFFFLLKDGGEIENNDLVRKLGVSRNVLNQVKQKLSLFFKPASENTQLDNKKLEIVKAMFDSDYKTEEFLWIMFEDKDYKKSLALLKKEAEEMPLPERKYDQFIATQETTARRASLLQFFGDIKGKNLLFLGDDDFTSVVVSSCGEPKSVTVADIDKRILKGIKTVSDKHNFGIKVKQYDAREKLPDDLRGKFDIVFTDPPYTKEGVELFVSRAIDSLDPSNKAARIYICYGNSDRAKERFLPIYEIFSKFGLMVRWTFDKFNRYTGAESIGSASSLYICEITPKTKSYIKGDYDRQIYTNN